MISSLAVIRLASNSGGGRDGGSSSSSPSSSANTFREVDTLRDRTKPFAVESVGERLVVAFDGREFPLPFGSAQPVGTYFGWVKLPEILMVET